MSSRIPSFLNPLALSLAGLTALTACSGGGGGGGGGPTIGNLTVTNVRLVSNDPNAAHEMTLAVTVQASQAYSNVPVAYVLLDRSDVDSEADEVRQYEVSTSVLSAVAAGAQEIDVVVTIPTETRQDGEWYLVPHLDPGDVITETDETDNEPTDGSKVPVTIGNANTDSADIVLESVAIEQDAIVLGQGTTTGRSLGYTDPRDAQTSRTAQDERNHDFDATLEISTTGSRDLSNVDITATITVPGRGDLELRFWNAEQSRYESQVLTPVTPGIPTTVNMDVAIPDSTRQALIDHLTNGGSSVFEVVFSSNMTAGVTEWENGNLRYGGRTTGSDNRIAAELVILLQPSPQPDPCDPLTYDSGYKKDWANDAFSIGVDFGSNASLDERGAIGQAHANVPVTLFGARANAIELSAFGRVLPHEGAPTDSEFRADFKIFGVTLYTRSAIDPSVTYEQEETFTRTTEARGRVFAGPIPIALLARSTGTLGYRIRAYLDPALMEVEGQAFGRVEGFASASVNAVVVEAGVAGEITLLDDVFTARAACQLGTPSGGRIAGTLRLQAINQLSGPNGRIYVFERHTEPKWCYKVIPCGLRTVRNESTLVRFRSFAKTDVLFDLQETRSVCL